MKGDRMYRRRCMLAGCTVLVLACGSADRSYKGRSAEAWVSQLTAASAAQRTAAADALYHIAPRSDLAVTALLRAMRDPDAEVQAAVAVALSTIGPRALPGLIEAVSDDHARVRVLAVDVLASQGSSAAGAIPQIAKALADPDEDVRRAAAAALERFGPLARNAAPGLALAAGNGTPELRAACLLALVATRADTAFILPIATSSLGDAAAVVRRAAVRVVSLALADAGRKLALLGPLMRDQDTSVRMQAYRALGGLLGDSSVGPAIHSALVLARADPDPSARELVERMLSPAAQSAQSADGPAEPRGGVRVQRPE